jgi:hypothetical protein
VRFSGGFAENFGWDLFERNLKFEHGNFRTSPPAPDIPMGAHVMRVRMRSEIEQQGNLPTVKLLGKRR